MPEMLPAKSNRIGAVEGQRAAVEDIAGNAAGRAAVTHLQSAGIDRRVAGIRGSAPAEERKRPGAVLGEARRCRPGGS